MFHILNVFVYRMQMNEQERLNVHRTKNVNRQIELKFKLTKNKFIVNMLQAINITLYHHLLDVLCPCFHLMNLVLCTDACENFTFPYMHKEWNKIERAMIYIREHSI